MALNKINPVFGQPYINFSQVPPTRGWALQGRQHVKHACGIFAVRNARRRTPNVLTRPPAVKVCVHRFHV